jgi:hypothetical protein
MEKSGRIGHEMKGQREREREREGGRNRFAMARAYVTLPRLPLQLLARATLIKQDNLLSNCALPGAWHGAVHPPPFSRSHFNDSDTPEGPL